MLNRRDDFIFPLESVAKPLFALVGALPIATARDT